MKIISHEDIANLNISPAECYEWAQYMIENKQTAVLPAKISLKPFDGAFCNVMPCIVSVPNGKRYGGVKIVTRYPGREPALDSKLILFDADSGEFKAIIDANWITAMRTGAVAAHSVELFAKKDYKSIGIIGLGNTARATVSVLSAIHNSPININLLQYKEQEKLFTARFASYKKLHFECYDNIERLINESDVVISCATYFSNDLCSDKVYLKGILLIPIHTRGFTNCDLFFDKIFADDTSHVCHFKNFDKFKSFSEVSDVVNGKHVGRTNDDERILVYNIGVAMHDVFFASQIYEKIKNATLPELNFKSPSEKFWV